MAYHGSVYRFFRISEVSCKFFVISLIAGIAFIFLPSVSRIFVYIAFAITAVSAVSYWVSSRLDSITCGECGSINTFVNSRGVGGHGSYADSASVVYRSCKDCGHAQDAHGQPIWWLNNNR